MNKTDVKINNDYTYLQADDPTTAENQAAGYNGGETWLNISSGDSFTLSDPEAGTWKQIETALDAKIARAIPTKGWTLFRLTGDYFYRFRQESLDVIDEDVPDSIDRFCLDRLTRYVSFYAEWTVTKGVGETEIASSEIVGDLTALEVGDEIAILGSRRNDRLYTISALAAETITIDEEIDDDVDRFLILLVNPTADFDEIVGRMIWFDLTIRNARSGIQSERIGTYSYTLGPTIGGIGYPEDIASSFLQFMSAAPLGTADYIS